MSFPIQVDEPREVAVRLLERGIDSTRGYMDDCSTLPIFHGKTAGECPNAGHVSRHILHIPVHPNLREKELLHLVESVRRACQSK